MRRDHGGVDLQQLRYVVAVADTSNFTRAAERCHVTQSALSHQIAALERALGQRLFTRDSRSVHLTEAGAAFVVHARDALASVASAVEDAAAAEGTVIGTLRVGVIPTVTALDVAAALATFRRQHQSTRVEMRVGSSSDLMSSIRHGDLDIGFIGLHETSTPHAVAARELLRERLVAAVSADHPLARRQVVGLAELVAETFVDFPAGTPGRMQSDAAFAAAHLQRDVAFEADAASVILDLVAADLAIALLAPGVVERAGQAVVAVPVSDGPVRVEYVVWDAKAPRSVARAFLRVLDGTDRSREVSARRRRPSPSTS